MSKPVTFYFDLGSPFAYLAAERIERVLGGPVKWQPVSLGALFKLTGRSSWALGDYRRRQAGMADIESRARGYGLPAIRWPDPWPSHYLTAMRAAIYACQTGACVEYARAAFRLAFVEGRDLAIEAHVLEAARRAGLDPNEVQEATTHDAVKHALRAATDAAHARGVFGVPTVAVGDELFWGDDRLGDAAVKLAHAEAS